MLRSAKTPLLGSTTPRIFTQPKVKGAPGPCGCGCALTPATSKGFSAIEFAQSVLGMELIPWQRWLLIHALELRTDGRFRFRTILILIARQSGKTTLIEVKNLWKMFVENVSLIISVAQELDVAEESWDNAVAMVEGIDELNAELKHVDKTNGKKALRLNNGSRWKPKAAGRRPGRGLSGDDVNLDELREHQNYLAWAAVTKTTMARPNPQIWAFSNAGDDKSIVLNELRDKAIAALDGSSDVDEVVNESFGIFEWSAPDDVKCTCIERHPSRPHDSACKLRDPKAWAQANPSLGYTIDVEAIEAALATDPEEIFRTEVLCQRVPALEEGVIPAALWASLADLGSRRDGDLAVAVDISVVRDFASITVFGRRPDGLGHAQLIDYQPGTDWIVPRLIKIREELDPIAFGMGPGTYESLVKELTDAKFYRPDKLPEDVLKRRRNDETPRRGDLLVAAGADMAAACGQLIDAVRQRSFRVIPAAQMDLAVAGARLRQSGASDAQAWSRAMSEAEISPVGSLTLARFAYETRAWLFANKKKRAPAPPMPAMANANNLFRPTGRLKI